MTDKQAFIKDNKEILNTLFGEMYENEKTKVFSMPEGKARNIQIEFVKFLKKWLLDIDVFSKSESNEDKNYI